MIKNGAYTQTTSCKLWSVVRIVVDSLLPDAECSPNDHRKDAPPFSLRRIRLVDSSIDLTNNLYSFDVRCPALTFGY